MINWALRNLEQPIIRDWVTGKFVMEVQEDNDHNVGLAITVELALGVESNNQKEIAIASSNSSTATQ